MAIYLEDISFAQTNRIWFQMKKGNEDGKKALKCFPLKCETYVMIFGVDGLVLLVLILACECGCLNVFYGILLISLKRLVFIGLF